MRYYCFSHHSDRNEGYQSCPLLVRKCDRPQSEHGFRQHSSSALLRDPALSAPVGYKSSCELATNPCSSFAFIWKESMYLLRAKSVDLPRVARFLSSLCSPCGFITVTNRLHAVSSVLCINDKKIFPQPSPTPRSWIESFWVEVILQIFFWGLFFPFFFSSLSLISQTLNFAPSSLYGTSNKMRFSNF